MKALVSARGTDRWANLTNPRNWTSRVPSLLLELFTKKSCNISYNTQGPEVNLRVKTMKVSIVCTFHDLHFALWSFFKFSCSGELWYCSLLSSGPLANNQPSSEVQLQWQAVRILEDCTSPEGKNLSPPASNRIVELGGLIQISISSIPDRY